MLTFAFATDTLLVARGKYHGFFSVLSPFNLGLIKKKKIKARFRGWILVSTVTDGKLKTYFTGWAEAASFVNSENLKRAALICPSVICWGKEPVQGGANIKQKSHETMNQQSAH